MVNRIFSILLSIFLFVGANLAHNQAWGNPDEIIKESYQEEVVETNSNDISDIIYDEESKRQLIEEMNESVTTRPRVHSIDETVAKSPYQRTNTDYNAVPKLHGELFDVVFKFIKVMLAVAVASIIIYFLLLFVRKFYGDKLIEGAQKNDGNIDLKTPKNETVALKGFLNQTKNRQD